jgi:Skp family chaperone for outer membrane proteins
VLNVRISSLVATFVAGALLIGICLAQGQAPGQQAVAPRAASGGRVAVIDIGYIFRNHTRFKDAMENIKQDYENFEKYVREQQATLGQKTEKLKATPTGSSEFARLEEEIAEAGTKLRLDMGRKQKERIEREAEVYYNAYSEIEWHVQRFADRYGIDLVVRFNSEKMDPGKPESVLQGINKFVVFNRGLDISNNILNLLKDQTAPRGEVQNGSPQIPVPHSTLGQRRQAGPTTRQ